jgi:hypothetical protein
MKRTITVTQKNIDEGRRHSACGCPIALAAKAQGSRSTGVVGPYARLWGRRHVWLPPEARAFIGSFDRGDTVLPFEFEVQL